MSRARCVTAVFAPRNTGARVSYALLGRLKGLFRALSFYCIPLSCRGIVRNWRDVGIAELVQNRTQTDFRTPVVATDLLNAGTIREPAVADPFAATCPFWPQCFWSDVKSGSSRGGDDD